MASSAARTDASHESRGGITVSIILVITLVALIIVACWFTQRRKRPTVITFTPTGHPYMPETRQRNGVETFILESIPIVKYSAVLQRIEQIRVAEDYHSLSYTSLLRRDVQPKHVCPEVAVLATIGEEENGDTPITDSSMSNSKNKTPTKIYTIQGRDESRPNHEPASCSICAEDFLDSENVRILPCGHIYHQRCIDSWLLNFSGTCPLW